MQKSLLALFASALILTACNDKENAELQQTLAKNQQTIAQLQNELEKIKSTFPRLEQNSEVLFSKEETLQLTPPKDHKEDDYFVSEPSMSVEVNTLNTQVGWVNELINQQMYKIFHEFYDRYHEIENQSGKLKFPESKELKPMLKQQLQDFYLKVKKEVSKGETIGFSYALSASYLGQHGRLATFVFYEDIYTGGAHGIGAGTYINVDIDKKTIVKLEDVIPKQNQEKVRQLLWENYIHQRGEPFSSKENFYVPDDFYMDHQGIHFIYPVYAIASYAEGEQELILPWWELSDLVKPDVQTK